MGQDLHPIEALTQESTDASLLVVGTGGSGFARLRLGSVSRAVLREAPVVAVVPSVPERADTVLSRQAPHPPTDG